MSDSIRRNKRAPTRTAAAPKPKARDEAVSSDTTESLPNVDQWFRSSDDVRLGFASGNSFELKQVRYAAIGNMAIFEGDIALGTVEYIERVAHAVSDPGSVPLNGVAITGERFRWPGGVIPYVIDPGLSNPQRVLDAIDHWTARTPIRLVPREADNPAHQNYVSFEEQDGCWSEVGMRGGKQVVSIGLNCGVGQAIHEIGHAVGLWHEQSREDRDQFVEILWENIVSGLEHNFTQHISDGDDVGTYDYGSIMHYPALAFSANGQPTIVPKQGVVIGQRNGLSDLDIAAVLTMYPGAPTAPQPQPQPGIEAGTRGAHVLGSVPPLDTRRWITADWPLDATVVWNIVPAPTSIRVEWNVVTERQDDALLKYYIHVRNLSDETATIEARYLIL